MKKRGKDDKINHRQVVKRNNNDVLSQSRTDVYIVRITFTNEKQ